MSFSVLEVPWSVVDETDEECPDCGNDILVFQTTDDTGTEWTIEACPRCRFCLTTLEEEIFDLLTDFGELTRTELSEKLKRPRTTVYDALNKLMFRGVVEKKPVHKPGKIGRPYVVFYLAEAPPYYHF